MIDLDNSVFMNFKRYTKEDVGAAFKADKDFFDFDEILDDPEDAYECAMVFKKFYQSFCITFHEVSAHYENFPEIHINDLAAVLDEIGFYPKEIADQIGAKVITKINQL